MGFGKLIRSLSFRKKKSKSVESTAVTPQNDNGDPLASTSKIERSKSSSLPRDMKFKVGPSRAASEDPATSSDRIRGRSTSFTFRSDPEKVQNSTFNLIRRKKSKQTPTSTYTLYNINNLSKEVQTSMISLCNLDNNVQTSTTSLNKNVVKSASTSSLGKVSERLRTSISSLKKQKTGSSLSLSRDSEKLKTSSSSLSNKQKASSSSSLSKDFEKLQFISSSLLNKQKVGSSSSLSKEIDKLQVSNSSSKKLSSSSITKDPDKLPISASITHSCDDQDRSSSLPRRTIPPITSHRSMDSDRNKISSSKGPRLRSTSLTFSREDEKSSSFTTRRKKSNQQLSTLTLYNINNFSKVVQTSLMEQCNPPKSKEVHTSTSSLITYTAGSFLSLNLDPENQEAHSTSEQAAPQKPPRQTETTTVTLHNRPRPSVSEVKYVIVKHTTV